MKTRIKPKGNILLLLLLINCLYVFSQNENYTLEKCIQIGTKNNLNIKKNQLTNQINEKTLEQSKANRIPTINAIANQQINWGRSIDPSSNQFINNQITSNNFGVSGSLVLFSGFQNQHTIEQNKLNYQAGEYDIEKSKNDITLNIIGYYMQIVLFTKQIEAAKLQYVNTQNQIDRTEKLLTQSMVTEDAVYKLKAQLSTDLQNINSINNQLKQAKLNLCQQMQIPFESNIVIDTTQIIKPIDIDTSDYLQTAKNAEKNMPQIKSMELRVQSSRYSLNASRGGYYPRLTLNGGIATIYSSQYKEIKEVTGINSFVTGYVNNDLSLPVYGYIPTYSQQVIPFQKQINNNLYQYVSLNLSVPLLNAKTTRIAVEKSKINIDLSNINKSIAINQLYVDIQIAYNNYVAAYDKYLTTNTTLDARRSSYKIANARFESSFISIYNFLEEKSGLSKAELDFLQAKYELIFRRKILDFYKGELNY
ncbi:MAG: TolC family protein [Bacteroidota bacterium]|nr:TolC family protein [Bacteroidota bacterium]